MSDLDNITEEETALPVVDELASLKAKADLMGVEYHPSIGADKLRAKIAAKLAEDTAPAQAADAPAETTPVTSLDKPADKAEAPVEEETAGAKRARARKDALRLVRVNIQCLNPAKKEWEGEIITVGNATVGTVKKFVPFNTPEGYHIPFIMYQMLKARECQIFQSKKLPNGGTHREGFLKREFAIELLEPLSQDELDELARRQALAGTFA
jgi:hypothetical protein